MTDDDYSSIKVSAKYSILRVPCVETQAVRAPSDITLALVRTGARAQVDHRMCVLVSVAVSIGMHPVSNF